MSKNVYIKIRFYIYEGDKIVGRIDWPVNVTEQWTQCKNPSLLNAEVLSFFKLHCNYNKDSTLTINFKKRKPKQHKRWKY